VLSNGSRLIIGSIVHETSEIQGTDKKSNNLSIDLSISGQVPKSRFGNMNLRLFLSITPETIRILDYLTQRYNEYFSLNSLNVTSYDYNNFLKRTVEGEGYIFDASMPFAPVSTDLVTRDNILDNNVSIYGDGSSVFKDVMIYDVPFEEAYEGQSDRDTLLKTVKLELPNSVGNVTNLSVYAFLYNNKVPKVTEADPIDNFSISTGMSFVARKTPLGERTIYVSPTPEKMLLGTQEERTVRAPDSQSFLTLDKTPVNDTATSESNNIEQQSTVKKYEFSKIVKDTNIFSNIWVSRGLENSNKIVFAFDIRSFLIKNSVHPFVYESDSLFDAAINGLFPSSRRAEVLSVEVSRNHIKDLSYVSNNGLTFENSSKMTPTNQYSNKRILKAKEVDINVLRSNQNGQFVFYECYDELSEYTESNRYTYSVTCAVQDISVELIREITNSLYRGKSIISDIKSNLRASDIKVYDFMTDSLTQSVGSIDMTVGDRKINVLEQLERLLEQYDIISSSLDPAELSGRIMPEYLTSFRRDGGRIKVSLLDEIEELFDNQITSLFQKLEKTNRSNPITDKTSVSAPPIRDNSNSGRHSLVLVANHDYVLPVEAGKDKGHGYDYIFDKERDKGVNTLTVDEFIARGTEEFGKYFESAEELSEPAGTYRDPSLAYFTPKIVKTQERDSTDQTNINSTKGGSIEYSYDKYAQMFSDIVTINYFNKELGIYDIYLPDFKPNKNRQNNQLYLGVLDTLNDKYGLNISTEATPQFSAPAVQKGNVKTTIYDTTKKRGNTSCETDSLIPSIIGGASSTSDSVKSYLSEVNTKIDNTKPQDSEQSVVSNVSKERAIKVPFMILGELELNSVIGTSAKDTDSQYYNSLTSLREILSLTANNISERIESDELASLPNQLKNMLIISSTSDDADIGSLDSLGTYKVRRPFLKEQDTTSENTVSVFSNNKNVPPYPETDDPMKSYTKFLAFWMNYRQIAVVEYLDSFSSVEGNGTNRERLKLDNWRTLDSKLIDSPDIGNGKILCRIRVLEPVEYLQMFENVFTDAERSELLKFFETKQIFNLPLYNQYFYIQQQDGSVNAVSNLSNNSGNLSSYTRGD
jgi:hypothetical protein